MCGVSLHIIPWQFRLKSLLFPKLQEYGSKKDQDGFARVVKAKTQTSLERSSLSQELFRDANRFTLCHIAPCPHSVIL